MISNIDERICDNFAKEHISKYKEKIEEIMTKYIFLEDEEIISQIAEFIKNDDIFLNQFVEREQEDKERIATKIAETLLDLYRNSLNAMQNPKTNSIDWSSEYKKALALYVDEDFAREIVVDQIRKEIDVDIITAGRILDRAINNYERQ